MEMIKYYTIDELDKGMLASLITIDIKESFKLPDGKKFDSFWKT